MVSSGANAKPLEKFRKETNRGQSAASLGTSCYLAWTLEGTYREPRRKRVHEGPLRTLATACGTSERTVIRYQCTGYSHVQAAKPLESNGVP